MEVANVHATNLLWGSRYQYDQIASLRSSDIDSLRATGGQPQQLLGHGCAQRSPSAASTAEVNLGEATSQALQLCFQCFAM